MNGLNKIHLNNVQIDVQIQPQKCFRMAAKCQDQFLDGHVPWLLCDWQMFLFEHEHEFRKPSMDFLRLSGARSLGSAA